MKLVCENQLIIQVVNETSLSPIEVMSTPLKQAYRLCCTSSSNESSNTITKKRKYYPSNSNKFGHCKKIKNDDFSNINFQVLRDPMNRNPERCSGSSVIGNVSCDNSHIQKSSSRFDHHMKPLCSLPQGKPLRCYPRLRNCNLMLKSPPSNNTKRKLDSEHLSQMQRNEKKICCNPATDVQHALSNEFEKENIILTMLSIVAVDLFI